MSKIVHSEDGSSVELITPDDLEINHRGELKMWQHRFYAACFVIFCLMAEVFYLGSR